MSRCRHLPAFVALCLLMICGCQAEIVPTAAISADTPQPAVATLPATGLPTRGSQEQPHPSATWTPAPSATPSPVPAVVVAVPASWQAAVQAATTQEKRWHWRPITTEAAAEMLGDGGAQLAVVAGDRGIPVGTRPLALTVPFGDKRHGITLDEARQALNAGGETVTVVSWEALQPEQKALYVDGVHVTDPDYPIRQEWSILAAEGYEPAAEALAAQLRAQDGMRGIVHVAAVGDVMLDRALGEAIHRGDLTFPFAGVSQPLQAADLTIANLECALGDVGEPAAKSYTFRAPPGAAGSLAGAGIDLVSLANNHALDFGPAALLQGIELLHEQNIATVGAGPDHGAAHLPAMVTVDDLTLAFLAYVNVPVEGNPPYFDTQTWTATGDTPGLAWGTPEQIQLDVAALAPQVDHVVVMLHSGYEYRPEPSPAQRAAARAAIDAGAALVVGHHAHILQGVEFYQEGVIVYGLGNFAFTITGPPETAILNAWFDEDGIRQLEFIPAIVLGSGQPRLANEVEAAAIRQRIYALSAALN